MKIVSAAVASTLKKMARVCRGIRVVVNMVMTLARWKSAGSLRIKESVVSVMGRYDMDCDYCANQDTHLCEECVHAVELSDHFEEITEEQRAAKLREAFKKIPSVTITTDIPEHILDYFKKAKLVTIFEAGRPEHFAAVYFGENYIAASDTYRLIYFADVAIPVEIRDKYVLEINGDEVRAIKERPEYSPLKGTKILEILNDVKGYSEFEFFSVDDFAANFTENIDEYETSYVAYQLGGEKVYFNRRFSDDAMTLLRDAEHFRALFRGKLKPVHFKYSSMTIVMLPVRIDMARKKRVEKEAV